MSDSKEIYICFRLLADLFAMRAYATLKLCPEEDLLPTIELCTSDLLNLVAAIKNSGHSLSSDIRLQAAEVAKDIAILEREVRERVLLLEQAQGDNSAELERYAYIRLFLKQASKLVFSEKQLSIGQKSD
jgi:hypothetical protein